jgi:hypothetical protein
LVDVREIDFLHVSLRKAGASEEAQIGSELLFEIQRDTSLGAKWAK